MQKNIIKLISLLLAITLLTACGHSVEIPPAHKGKILTKNGYAPETLNPSKFRLEWCMFYCDNLVLVQTADTPFSEELQIFMPKDKLNLTVDIRGTLSIPTTEKTLDSLYDRIQAQQTKDKRVSIIPLVDVFNTYGRPALRGIVRSKIADYTIGEILSNRATIGEQIHAAIASKLNSSNTPIKITRFELANVQPPEVIVLAQEKAKEREIAIDQAEADAKVQMVEAERELEVAKVERAVRRERALTIAEENKIAAESITPQLLQYRRLEVTERIFTRLAQSENSMIIPADMGAFSVGESAAFAKMIGKEIKQ